MSRPSAAFGTCGGASPSSRSPAWACPGRCTTTDRRSCHRYGGCPWRSGRDAEPGGPCAGRSARRRRRSARAGSRPGPSRPMRSGRPGSRRCCCRTGCGRTRRRLSASVFPKRRTWWPGCCAGNENAGRRSPCRRGSHRGCRRSGAYRSKQACPPRRGSTSGCRPTRPGCSPGSPCCACGRRRSGPRA